MTRNTSKIIYPELSYKLTGILFEARRLAGRFSNEKQYCDSIDNLLKKSGISFEREKFLPPSFDGEGKRNKVDFLIDGKIILEVKAKPYITKQDYYQTQRYLSALNKKLAILVNMRRYYIVPKRILNSGASE